jgi:hypothetical protein
MLQRPSERADVRERWAIGAPYQDEAVATVTVATRRSLGLAGRAAMPLEQGRAVATSRRIALAGLLLTAAALAAFAVAPAAAGIAAAIVASGTLAATGITLGRVAAGMVKVPGQAGLEDMAVATADALMEAGLTSRGGDAVRVEAMADGSYRARLQDVPAAESTVFTTALDDVLSPLAQPRYLIPRLIVQPPHGPGAAFGLLARRLVLGRAPGTVVYHAVPSVLAGKKQLAAGFERAWNAHVSPGRLIYSASPEGTGILAVQRGDDPFAVTTQIRTLWR